MLRCWERGRVLGGMGYKYLVFSRIDYILRNYCELTNLRVLSSILLVLVVVDRLDIQYSSIQLVHYYPPEYIS